MPIRIRQALYVEAGLNDGLSVPFLMFFIALAAARIEGGETSLMQFIVEQLGYGVLIGAGIGLVGGSLLGLARRIGWMEKWFRRIGVVSLPLLCLVISEMVGASMFIAAFVAGWAVQIGFKEAGKHSVEFAEGWVDWPTSPYFPFGLAAVLAWPQFILASALYALLSLTVVRMLPVAIALVGTRLSPASVVFMGWFGPRGLASIVLGLVYLEQEMQLPGEATIRLAVTVTVLLASLPMGLARRLASASTNARSRRSIPPRRSSFTLSLWPAKGEQSGRALISVEPGSELLPGLSLEGTSSSTYVRGYAGHKARLDTTQ